MKTIYLVALFLIFGFMAPNSYGQIRSSAFGSPRATPVQVDVKQIEHMLSEHLYDEIVIVNLPVNIETFRDTQPSDLEHDEYKFKLVNRIFRNSKQEHELLKSLIASRYTPSHAHSADFRWGCILYMKGKRVVAFFLNQSGNLLYINGKSAIVDAFITKWFNENYGLSFSE